ncbi:ABC transporter ATP-binding protein [Brucella sp. 21LCYQ03]|nr:ABC transporter ATP-binding protein [Brucella sp. 21LCYQ03]
MPQSIELTNIGKSFGVNDVLKGINLSIRPGEFISLVGMSGCGKSTLLRIIAGLESPDNGAVAIGNHDVTDIDPSDRNLAMVFQSYALYPHMNVRQNIATPLRMRKLKLSARLPLIGRLLSSAHTLSEINDEVVRAAETLHIEHLLDRKPAQLSGGQRQRVALARALVRSPAAFLMDEPLSNLDAKLRAHMRNELAQLHRRLGATFVYVTHDQIEAMTMSDRIALMSEGRIEQLGTPDELYSRPATLTVARFIGTPSINLLPVEIDNQGQVTFIGKPLGISVAPGQSGSAMLGLRAEDLYVVQNGLAARIERSETHGADRFVTCRLLNDNNIEITLRQRAGEKLVHDDDGNLHLGFAPDRVHLFGENGLRIEAMRERVLA